MLEHLHSKFDFSVLNVNANLQLGWGEKNQAYAFLTYPINQLSHHAVPHLSFRVSGSIFAIRNKLQLVLVAHMLGDLCGQLHNVAFILVIPHQLLVVFLQHHVWRLLRTDDRLWIEQLYKNELRRHVLRCISCSNCKRYTQAMCWYTRDRLVLLF